jgi:hypothetical protein
VPVRTFAVAAGSGLNEWGWPRCSTLVQPRPPVEIVQAWSTFGSIFSVRNFTLPSANATFLGLVA